MMGTGEIGGAANSSTSLAYSFPDLTDIRLLYLPKLRSFCSQGNSNSTELTSCPTFFGKKIAFPSLESLVLHGMNHVKQVWDVTSHEDFTSRFSKLQELILCDLEMLQPYAFPITDQEGAARLKVLRVYKCKNLEYIFSFPTTAANMMGTGEIGGTANCSTSIAYSFPDLKDITLKDLPKLRGFCYEGNSNSTEVTSCATLFGKKIAFPSLESLELLDMNHVEQVWDVTSNDDFTSRFSKLHELRLWKLEMLQPYAFPITDQENAARLKVLTVEYCKNLEYIFSFPTTATNMKGTREIGGAANSSTTLAHSFPDLKEMRLYGLPKLRGFCYEGNSNNIEVTSCATLFGKKIAFPSLKLLHINGMAHVEQVWDVTSHEDFTSRFPKLKSLSFNNCNKMRHPWSKKVLLAKSGIINFTSLENIRIESCSCIVSLFSPLTTSCTTTPTIIFPKLQELTLEDLESFQYVYPGSAHMKFQALNKLTVYGLPKVKTLVRLERFTTDMEASSTAAGITAGPPQEEEPRTEGKSIREEDVGNEPILFKGNVEFPRLAYLKADEQKGRACEIEERDAAGSSSSNIAMVEDLHFVFPLLERLERG